MVVVTANLVLLVRVGAIAAVVSPGVLVSLAPILGLGLLLGAFPPLRIWSRAAASTPSHGQEIKNPLEMGSTLSFGAIYAIVLVVTARLRVRAGAHGIYAAAPVLGLTDTDPILLSTLRLFDSGQLQAPQVATAVAFANMANLCFKVASSWVIAGRELATRVALGFLPVLGGLLFGHPARALEAGADPVEQRLHRHGAALARNLAAVLEDNQGWDTANAVARCDVGRFLCIEFRQTNVRLEQLRGLFEHRRHRPARSTPRRPEVHDYRNVAAADVVVEILHAECHRLADKERFVAVPTAWLVTQPWTPHSIHATAIGADNIQGFAHQARPRAVNTT